ncbi:hypothetical protein M413DRAFT_143034 [Hebeloma cylindrosporum]|uniref:Uncharacterized protein n=1 Tax=Hebeloma cylindrosporum TaxID=76867 RepID=A0A0C3CEE9_HEBCY|nr:hypothetical protein M413DRAFT_143034 [Hebeloma cylindrosporum h7]
MILDEKVIMSLPPPPYLSNRTHRTPPSLQSTLTLTSLPPHILLQIIHHTFPQGIAAAPTPLNSASYGYDTARLYQDTKPERQRKTLFWLSTSLRLVSRTLYTACMHVLRSTYLPAYQALIRPPYSTDPFPIGVLSPNSDPSTSSSSSSPPAYDTPTPPTTSSSPLITLHRETAILDHFILLKVRQDVFLDDTSLHIDREDAFRDLFDVAQPRARLEDLVRIIGVKEGIVYVPGARSNNSASFGTTTATTSTPPKHHQESHSTDSPPRAQSQPQAQQHPPKPRRSFFSFLSSSSPSSSPSPSPTPSPSPFPSPAPQITPLPFPALSISFSPRRAGLILNRTRTVAEVARRAGGYAGGGTGTGARGRETLEELAAALVGGLKVWLVEG